LPVTTGFRDTSSTPFHFLRNPAQSGRVPS
jgi:hypothetical protein